MSQDVGSFSLRGAPFHVRDHTSSLRWCWRREHRDGWGSWEHSEDHQLPARPSCLTAGPAFQTPRATQASSSFSASLASFPPLHKGRGQDRSVRRYKDTHAFTHSLTHALVLSHMTLFSSQTCPQRDGVECCQTGPPWLKSHHSQSGNPSTCKSLRGPA